MVLLSSLFLSYTSICQTCETLEQSASCTSCTIFSHPEYRRRLMQPATVICFPSHFLYLPSNTTPTPGLCHFPHQFHPYLSSLAIPQVIALHHCHAPNCFFSSSCVPLFPPLNPFFCYACLSSFFKSLKLVTYFPTGLVFIWYNFSNFLSLPQQHARQS